jgi:uncharacterized membrane protein
VLAGWMPSYGRFRLYYTSRKHVPAALRALIDFARELLNLNKIQGLGAPIASIGGAGTFDGIFITGLLAVFYAGLAGEARD